MSRLRQQNQHQRMMTTPVNRLVRQLAVPSVLTMLVTSLYNLVETLSVGKLGPEAIGAIGVNYSLMALIQAVGFFFGHGSGNYISRKLGERRIDEAAAMAIVGVVTAFLTGVLFLAIGICYERHLVMWLGSTATIAPLACEYMTYVLLGAPFFASSLTLGNQLRLQGAAGKAMMGICIGALINCLLDPLLIFGAGMGIQGAGLSTFLSQVVSFSILLVMTQRGQTVVKLSWCNFRPSSARYLAILQGGLPSMGRQGVNCVSNVLLSHAMKLFGDPFFAAMTIVFRLSGFVYAITAGIGQGFQPVSGFNYGARRFGRVISAYMYTQKLTLTFLFVATLVLAVFAPWMIDCFTSSQEVVRLGTTALRWQCTTIPFIGIIMIGSMLLQNINRYKEATWIALSRSGIFFIPMILILPSFAGATGVMLAHPISDVLSFLTALPLLHKVVKELKQPLERGK